MTLDNRSRSILVSGEEQSPEAQNSIKEYYESNGGNVSVNENVGFVVTYPNREMAEKVSPSPCLTTLFTHSNESETDPLVGSLAGHELNPEREWRYQGGMAQRCSAP